MSLFGHVIIEEIRDGAHEVSVDPVYYKLRHLGADFAVFYQ